MKKELFILLIASIIIVSGCEQNKDDVKEGPFLGGQEGVGISFVDNAPPTEFSKSDKIPVKVLLENKGEYDVKSGEVFVKLFGVNQDQYGLPSDYIAVQGGILGITEFVTEGGEQKVDVGNIEYKGMISNFFDANLRAKVCYPYSTEAQITACISSVNTEEGDGDSVCSIDGEKITDGSVSSGPLQITSFTESLRGIDEVLFNIQIENLGGGDVFDSGIGCNALDDAVLRGDAENIVKVNIKPIDIECNFLGTTGSEGDFELTAGTKTLTCKTKAKAFDSNYDQNINIELSYKYVKDTIKAIKIYE